MPSCTRLCASRLVMSRPSSAIEPAVGRSTPVSRLMIVVLPAPFGPISAWRAPFSIDSDTSLVATMPPNSFTRLVVSSTGDISAPPCAGKLATEAALYGDRAIGDPRRELQDVRPRQPKHRHHHDGK